MADLPMTPDEARDVRVELHHRTVVELFEIAYRALATLANMRVEHDHGVMDWETVDGRYEVYHRTRLVGEWQDT